MRRMVGQLAKPPLRMLLRSRVGGVLLAHLDGLLPDTPFLVWRRLEHLKRRRRWAEVVLLGRRGGGGAALRFEAAQALVALGLLEDAGRELEEVLRQEPRHVEAAYLLGNVLSRQDRCEEACARFEALLAQSPQRRERVLLRLGQCLEAEGRLSEAQDRLLEARRALTQAEETAETLALAVELERALPDRQARIASLGKALRRTHDVWSILGRLGELATLTVLDAEACAQAEALVASRSCAETLWFVPFHAQLAAGEREAVAEQLLLLPAERREAPQWSLLMRCARPEHFVDASPEAEVPYPGAPATRRDIAFVCCHFNPCSFRSRLATYRTFRDHVRWAGARLLTVELAFGDRPFELQGLDDVVHLRGGDVLWQKERLLNIGIQQLLKEGYEKIGWLDADIIFEAPDWVDRISAALDRQAICQAFDRVHRRSSPLDPGRYLRGMVFAALGPGPSAGVSRCSGFAWAARAELLKEQLLYDCEVLGGGDMLLAVASFPDPEGLHVARIMRDRMSRWSPRLLGHFRSWEAAWRERVGGRLGYVEQPIQSLYHGTITDRGYKRRSRILLQNAFSPAEDIAHGGSGCWVWASDKPAMHDAVAGYFRDRREDGGGPPGEVGAARGGDGP